jgi:hypothetical protein
MIAAPQRRHGREPDDVSAIVHLVRVLHAIAVSLVVARPLTGRPRAAALAGVVVIVAGLTLSSPLFDNRWLGWLGFMTHKPVTEDYVPVFPWTGVLLLGIAAGHALVQNRFALLSPLGRAPRALRFLDATASPSTSCISRCCSVRSRLSSDEREHSATTHAMTPMQPTRYQVAALDPNAHLFEVRCTIDDPDPQGQRYRLPTWIPAAT